jgi:hypothetical protein
MPLGILRQLRDLINDPAGNSTATETVRGLVAQLTDLGKAHSPLWTHRSLRRGLETLSTPLDDLLQASKRLGGTLNAAFLTAAADAAGAYHREFGAPVETLRASMAVSTRNDGSGSNAFTLARLTVPTGVMSVHERFSVVREQANTALETSAAAPLEKLAGVASALPTAVLTRIARQQSQTVDFATSNLRATPMPVFICGAEVLGNYPLGPLAGVAFNLTAMSYNGALQMGLHVDCASIEHPERLRKLLEQAFRRFAKAS